MQVHRAELDAIAAQPEAPGFDNTLAAFDRCARLLGRIESVFYNLTSSQTSPELQAVQREMAAPLSAHCSAVYMHAGLFARVDALFGRRASLGLTPEQLRLLERTHLDFVRSGARLAPDAQARYAQVMEQLAELTTQFAQNVLHDEASYQLVLQGEADLAGLPGFLRDAARQAASERGLPDGHVITLSRSLIVPFLTFSERRDLREQAWRAWVGRGEQAGEHDNRPVARAILALRAEQAALHGHACYADYALTDTMAGTRAAVHKLLDDVWPRALDAVQRERAELQQLMREQGAEDQPIEAWDWRYWAEKVRQQRYALDDAQIKPYFPLPGVVQAAFDCARRLFGLSFTPREDLPVYHPDVKAYEVRDAAGKVLAIFLQDNFARAAKRSGAWMSTLRLQSRNEPGGGSAIAVVLNNNNFAKGAPGAPTLLSLEDARTLFHEFGHGLHGMLSDVTYERLSGTQVLKDFVELPSQIFEHWIGEPSVLNSTRATGRRRADSRCADRAHAGGAALQPGLRDGALLRQHPCRHGGALAAARADPGRPQRLGSRAAAPAGAARRRGEPPLVHFQHLFSSSDTPPATTSPWAEVLDADGFEAFVEAGDPFDAQVAERLRRYVYASGTASSRAATQPSAAAVPRSGRCCASVAARAGLMRLGVEPVAARCVLGASPTLVVRVFERSAWRAVRRRSPAHARGPTTWPAAMASSPPTR